VRVAWCCDKGTVLRLVLVAASLRLAPAQYCSPGAVATCDAILVVSTNTLVGADVRATLFGTGAFATVDLFNASSSTPNASQLAAYHAVFVFSGDDPLSDATLLGDRLADFHDQGGGVVVAYAANSGNNSDHSLGGAYGTADKGYALLDYASGSWDALSDELGDVLEPQSPLLTGVSFLAASNALRSTAVMSGRAIIVARWKGGAGEPLVLRGQRGNRTLVELNFYPSSSSLDPGYWIGDGAALMRNALKYSRCMLCRPGTFSATGEACAGMIIRKGHGLQLAGLIWFTLLSVGWSCVELRWWRCFCSGSSEHRLVM
jgi:hypothetical protein